ncbi:GPR1/FUN34/YaaH family transporter [Acidiferrimicrobium sp. IK]|uniref:GPR1/FUN34/YaaH family transporter n=1 Tax=Acidiferrimicrobium sp. IK TaxID=2871700 RepID=UPI0021CB70DF|nr:GPR1/FUN34/YaaH family transporter [Acidiferrimicrobium sp. IK]MCU4183123.1 GPR1/FUN34/YaaH family transporter [Acidiferrimicrobium sp. IK]
MSATSPPQQPDRRAGAPSAPARAERLEAMSRIMLRPIGSPLPLGMVGLGGASIVLTGDQLSWFPASQAHQVALVVILFAAPIQLLAAVFGFLGRDGAGGTGMALLGVSWLTVGGLTLSSPPGSRSQVLGLLLFFVSAALMVPATASALGKVAAAVAFVMAGARFALTGVYEWSGIIGWERASGWLGIALCVVALYNAFAFEVEDTKHRTILPVLRWGAGKRAMDGSVLAEVEKVEQEAGVREQL